MRILLHLGRRFSIAHLQYSLQVGKSAGFQVCWSASQLVGKSSSLFVISFIVHLAALIIGLIAGLTIVFHIHVSPWDSLRSIFPFPIFQYLYMTLIIFLSLSNGISLIRWYCLRSSSFWSHHFIALTISAHSVGSHITVLLSSFELLHKSQISNNFEKLCGSAEKVHTDQYHVHVTSIIWLLTNSLVTVISFLVSVPVLSVHMTLTDHSVSTDDSLLTSTFFLTNLLTQSPSDMVTTAGNHSGMAATASATAVRNATWSSSCLIKKYVRNIIIQINTVAIHSHLLSQFSFFSRLVSFSGTSCSISAILPISVSIHIAVTTACHLHLVIMVPLNTMFFVSHSAQTLAIGLIFFSTENDSHVRIDS